MRGLIQSLEHLEPKLILLAVDGPKNNRANDAELVRQTQELASEITWDADMDPLPPGAAIPEAKPGGPSLQGKPLTRTFISSSVAAQDVLKKLDVAMDKVNQTRATMGAVMNRLDHVINNLSNVSMNLSASRSQIEDSDYAAASTEMAKNQIMQQAATAVLAQANTSQQSVLKLLGG